MANNPIRFTDPSGHDICGDEYDEGCKDDDTVYKTIRNADGSITVCEVIGGGVQEDTCQIAGAPNKSNPHSVSTSPIYLEGGPGTPTGSYGAADEDSWTGFSTSGETNSGGPPDPGVFNDWLVWARDVANIRPPRFYTGSFWPGLLRNLFTGTGYYGREYHQYILLREYCHHECSCQR